MQTSLLFFVTGRPKQNRHQFVWDHWAKPCIAQPSPPGMIFFFLARSALEQRGEFFIPSRSVCQTLSPFRVLECLCRQRETISLVGAKVGRTWYAIGQGRRRKMGVPGAPAFAHGWVQTCRLSAFRSHVRRPDMDAKVTASAVRYQKICWMASRWHCARRAACLKAKGGV